MVETRKPRRDREIVVTVSLTEINVPGWKIDGREDRTGELA